MGIVINPITFNLKYHDKCKFALTFISLATTFNLFSLEVVQNANIANFVYYGKTRKFNQQHKIYIFINTHLAYLKSHCLKSYKERSSLIY